MKRMDQINVIPFIDVMLVLLAIVLTTATFLIEGRLPIRLPAAETQAAPLDVTPVEIAIAADGQIFWGNETVGAGPAALVGLEPRFDQLAPGTPVVLRVDAQARFEAFIGVVDRLKARGIERVSILTRRL
jgi:biopolymer transport protein ExbD